MTSDSRTTISRVAFCVRCYESNRPNKSSQFAVFGTTSHKTHYFRTEYRGKRGFTPHFFVKISGDRNLVTFHSVCGIEDCGTIFFFKKINGEEIITHEFVPERIKVGSMRTVDWNALQSFRDPEYYI